MSSGLEYMRPVTITSVGVGGIVDENGRSLVCVGNLPIKPGDKVWTDGRIIYGHIPVRQNVTDFSRVTGYPFCGFGAGLLRRNGAPYGWSDWRYPDIMWFNLPSEIRPLDGKGGVVANWMYTTKDAIYCAYMTDGGIPQHYAGDLNCFLDMRVTKTSVFTAEFLSQKAPWHGLNADAPQGKNRPFRFFAINFYYTQSEGTDDFGFNWAQNRQVSNNPILVIKQNGTAIAQMNLGQFEFAIDKLKEIYLEYNDDGGDAEIWKRYSQKGNYSGEELTNVDIWVSYLHTQVLNFVFTNDSGAWEMIILTIAEGVCSPHTIDQEYDRDEGAYKDVSSYYHVYCPIVCYVLRVKSTGAVEILQHWLVVNKNTNNGISKREWTNAQGAEVTEINEKEFPVVRINCPDNCAIMTDFRRTFSGVANGRRIQYLIDPDVCGYLETTNPDKSVMTEGAVNSFRRERLWTGNAEIKSEHQIGLWAYESKYTFCESPEYGFAQLTTGATSYFGRLAFWQISDNRWVYSVFPYSCVLIDNEAINPDEPSPTDQETDLKRYCFNINFEYVKNLRRATHNIKTITDLIADVTAGKLSGNQGG